MADAPDPRKAEDLDIEWDDDSFTGSADLDSHQPDSASASPWDATKPLSAEEAEQLSAKFTPSWANQEPAAEPVGPAPAARVPPPDHKTPPVVEEPERPSARLKPPWAKRKPAVEPVGSAPAAEVPPSDRKTPPGGVAAPVPPSIPPRTVSTPAPPSSPGKARASMRRTETPRETPAADDKAEGPPAAAAPSDEEELPPPRREMDTTPALGRRARRQRQTPVSKLDVPEDSVSRPTSTRQWGSFLLAAGIGAALVFGVVRLTEGPATPTPVPSEAPAVAPTPPTQSSAAGPLRPVPLESIPVPLDSIPAEQAPASNEDEDAAPEEKEASQPAKPDKQAITSIPKAVPRRAAPQPPRKTRLKRPVVAQPTRPSQPARPPQPKPAPARPSEGSGSSTIVREAPF